jgi:acetyl esterase/lipase
MTVPRPVAGRPAATIAGTVLIDELVGGSWSPLASSWPADGMPAAGVPVPAVDQLGGAVLPPQGSELPGTRRGGINTRAQDSICREDSSPGTGPRGSTTALGDLPFPYEVQEPGGNIRGTMILLHGGGWYLAGRGVMESMRGDADRWLSRGWRIVNSSYRACAASIVDVATLFDRVQSVYGTKIPICADGQSSGGHLALLLSAVRSRLACVVAQGAPADLQALPRQTEGGAGSEGPIKVTNMAVAAFGEDLMAHISPTRAPVKARVLFALAAQDTAIPYAQATGFAAAQRARDHDAYVDPVHLTPGPVPWIHGLVSQKALVDLHNREKKLVAPLVNATVSAPATVRIASLRRSGLRVRYTCPNTCTVKVRLTLGGRTVASADAQRSGYGAGKLTLRLAGAAGKRAKSGRARVVADVKAGRTRKRVARAVSVRR